MAKEKIQLPAMSDQMTDAELLSWKISAGDKVNKGDILCEISTDKVDMDLDSPFTGEILSLKVEECDVVNVVDAIAEIETEEESLLGSIFYFQLTRSIFSDCNYLFFFFFCKKTMFFHLEFI